MPTRIISLEIYHGLMEMQLLFGGNISFSDPNAVAIAPADFYMALNPLDANSSELPHTSLNFVKINSFIDDSVKTVQSLPQAVEENGVVTNKMDLIPGKFTTMKRLHIL